MYFFDSDFRRCCPAANILFNTAAEEYNAFLVSGSLQNLF